MFPSDAGLLRRPSPPDDEVSAVVVSPHDASGHVFEGAEPWLMGQSVCSQRLQSPTGRLGLLQGAEASDVLPADQTQRVLQIILPQRCLSGKHGKKLDSVLLRDERGTKHGTKGKCCCGI